MMLPYFIEMLQSIQTLKLSLFHVSYLCRNDEIEKLAVENKSTVIDLEKSLISMMNEYEKIERDDIP